MACFDLKTTGGSSSPSLQPTQDNPRPETNLSSILPVNPPCYVSDIQREVTLQDPALGSGPNRGSLLRSDNLVTSLDSFCTPNTNTQFVSVTHSSVKSSSGTKSQHHLICSSNTYKSGASETSLENTDCQPCLCCPSVPHYSEKSVCSAEPFLQQPSSITQSSPHCIIISSEESSTQNTDTVTETTLVPQSEHIEVDSPELDVRYTHLTTSEVFEHFPCSFVRGLGDGSFGKVHLVQLQSSPSLCYAAKITYFNSKDKSVNERNFKNFQRETNILQNLYHANIINLINSVAGPSYAVLFLEYFPEGSLQKNMNSLTGTTFILYLLGIGNAIKYIHNLRIVHRDIKPDNVLVQAGNAVLTDFGMSKKLPKDSNIVSGCYGTAMFMAPEVKAAESKPYQTYDGLKADSFAFGVTIYSMILRGYPDDHPDPLSQLEVLISSGVRFEPYILRCTRKLLHPDPHLRGDVTEIIDDLEEIRWMP